MSDETVIRYPRLGALLYERMVSLGMNQAVALPVRGRWAVSAWSWRRPVASPSISLLHREYLQRR